ncbi:MAG: acyl carrier protein [Actinobacteria bacterium]|jgi:acyl carrier protein|nr:acyl carrier protein [Actinomycetota bacterium]
MTDKQQEIFAVIKEHLEGRGIEGDDITMEADLAGDIGLDSLDTVELTLALEQHYEIEIPDSELEELATVKDAVALIEKKVSVKT